MTIFVIDAQVAIDLAGAGATIPPGHILTAPTLLRSQALALVYESVHRGDIAERAGRTVLDNIRGLRIRLLGDRSLQDHAWRIATKLNWSDTYQAEYIALAQLQADALATADEKLAALLDPFTARTMRDIPADLISIKIGINVVNADRMRLRAFGAAVHGFLDMIRDGHPATTIIVISALYCPIHEHTPGPLAPDFSSGTMAFVATGDPMEAASGKLTLSVIRHELAAIVEQRSGSDPNIHYLNGIELYGPADFADFPLADNLHPSPQAHQRIGQRFSKVIREMATGRVHGHD